MRTFRWAGRSDRKVDRNLPNAVPRRWRGAVAALGPPANIHVKLRHGALALLVMAAGFGLLLPAGASASTFSNTDGITINDPASGCTPEQASPYPSTILVSGLSGTVSDVDVTITGLSHSWPDDVGIVLVGPSGASTIVMQDSGGGAPVSGVNLTFDDGASSPLPNESQITSGTYKPSQGTTSICSAPASYPSAPLGPYGTTLADFNGTDPNGTWSLYVIDDSRLDAGSITGWSLDVSVSSDGGSALDHFRCYDIDTSDPAPAERIRVSLSDKFGAHDAFVDRVRRLCNPVDKNEEGIIRPDAHLVSFQLTPIARRFPAQRVEIENQFGRLALQLGKPERLLVPASKVPQGQEPGAPPAGLDHFQCYEARAEDDFEPRTVSLVDQFLTGPARIISPTELCVPVDKNHEGPSAQTIDPSAGDLVCYPILSGKRVPNSVRDVVVRHQFGTNNLRATYERSLCVPSVTFGGVIVPAAS